MGRSDEKSDLRRCLQQVVSTSPNADPDPVIGRAARTLAIAATLLVAVHGT